MQSGTAFECATKMTKKSPGVPLHQFWCRGTPLLNAHSEPIDCTHTALLFSQLQQAGANHKAVRVELSGFSAPSP